MIALKSYADFKELIPEAFRITKGPGKGARVADFREAVGTQVLLYRQKVMTTTGKASDRHGRWRDWLEKVRFDEPTWKILGKLDDDTISSLTKDLANIEFYIALYYRLHADLRFPSFAEAIDELVFGSPLQNSGIFVFTIDTRPTAPFIHPPYVDADYVRARLERDPTDGIWLNPHNHHSIKLSGREKEKAHLDAFMARHETFLICPVIAPSGAGKTRLISEWMKRYVPSVTATEWDAGFVVSRDTRPWTKQEWSIARDTLIVIDYTFAYAEVVKEIAQRARNDGSGRKIRLIVIDHIFPKDLFNDAFWRSLYQTRSIMEGNHQELCETLEIRPEGSQSELLRDVAAAVASVGGQVFSNDHATIKNAVKSLYKMGEPSAQGGGYSNPDAVRHPLFAALLGHAVRLGRDFSHWSRRDLIQYYFSNGDRLPWETWNEANNRKRWGLVAGALVSAATLRRGLPIFRVEEKLPGEPQALIQYANRIVSSERTETLKPFEPDILGEAFLLKFLSAIGNYKVDEEKREAWDIFISMLEVSETDDERVQVAQNFQETIIRLVRNLLNDDHLVDSVKEGWKILDSFLSPERFPNNSLLLQEISIIRAEIVKQCRAAGETDRAAQFAKKIDVRDFQTASSGPLWRQAATSYMHYFDWTSLQGGTGGYDIASLTLIGRNFQKRSKNKWPPLMLAISEGCQETAKFLLQEFDEEIDAFDSEGWTALMLAAHVGHREVAERLIEVGADVGVSGMRNRWTALMSACRHGHLEISYLLLDRGAEVDQRTTDRGWTALMSACAEGQTVSAALLLDRGAEVNLQTTDNGWTALMMACQDGYTETAALLLERGAAIDQGSSDYGVSALMVACQNGHTATAALLLKRGAFVNQGTKDNGATALMAACQNGHASIADLLCKLGASINQGTTDIDATALLAACVNGHTAIAAFLVDRGAQIDRATTDDGTTALMMACQNGHAGTVALLLDRGAAINLRRTDNGWTALDYALAKGRRTVSELLHSAGGKSGRDVG